MEGKIVGKVLVEKASDIERELYLAVVVDRETSKVVIISSSEGGVEIETVAANTPEKINKHWVDPIMGLMPYQARSICFGLGLEGQAFKDGVKCVTRLYNLFMGEELTLAEINPLVVTKDGNVLAVDVRNANVDDSNKARVFMSSIERAVFRSSPFPIATNDEVFDSVASDLVEEIVLMYHTLEFKEYT